MSFYNIYVYIVTILVSCYFCMLMTTPQMQLTLPNVTEYARTCSCITCNLPFWLVLFLITDAPFSYTRARACTSFGKLLCMYVWCVCVCVPVCMCVNTISKWFCMCMYFPHLHFVCSSFLIHTRVCIYVLVRIHNIHEYILIHTTYDRADACCSSHIYAANIAHIHIHIHIFYVHMHNTHVYTHYTGARCWGQIYTEIVQRVRWSTAGIARRAQEGWWPAC